MEKEDFPYPRVPLIVKLRGGRSLVREKGAIEKHPGTCGVGRRKSQGRKGWKRIKTRGGVTTRGVNKEIAKSGRTKLKQWFMKIKKKSRGIEVTPWAKRRIHDGVRGRFSRGVLNEKGLGTHYRASVGRAMGKGGREGDRSRTKDGK